MPDLAIPDLATHPASPVGPLSEARHLACRLNLRHILKVMGQMRLMNAVLGDDKGIVDQTK
jgi:hypothetical protein